MSASPKRGRPKTTDRVFALRITEEDFAQIDALASRAPDVLSRHGVARVALRLGLALVEGRPGLMLGEGLVPPPGKRAPRRKRAEAG